MRVKALNSLRVTQIPPKTEVPWLSKHSQKWRLLDDFVVMVDDQVYTIPKGYIFDGSTIPRLFWMFYPRTYYRSWEASCLHDYFYSHLIPRELASKQVADQIFYHHIRSFNMPKLISKIFFATVSVFGRV